MSFLVDTSVWSLALRRDAPPDVPEVRALRDALAGGGVVATTGVILQELLQGVPERTRARIQETFSALEYLAPTREDHIAAAGVRDTLRAAGVQLGTIDALIAQLAVAGGHTLLTTDRDFSLAADHIGLRLWKH